MEFINAHGVAYTPSRWLDFDNVLLTPRPTNLDSSLDPRISTKSKLTSNFTLKVPVISASYQIHHEDKTALARFNEGGAFIFHKEYGDDRINEYYKHIESVLNTTGFVVITIGTAKEDLEVVEKVNSISAGRPVIICINNNGFNRAIAQLKAAKSRFSANCQFLCDGIYHPSEISELCRLGCNGIIIESSGTIYKIPSISLIMRSAQALLGSRSNAALIFKTYSSDADKHIKALSAGADCIMSYSSHLSLPTFQEKLQNAMYRTGSTDLMSFANNSIFMEI